MNRNILSTALAFLAVAFLLSSCSPEGDSIVGSNPQTLKPASKPSSTAQPALTCIGLSTTNSPKGGNHYYTITVMDSDGTHATNILVSSYPTEGLNTWSLPRWSPTGGSIAWVELYNNNGPWVWAIKAIDVAISNSGTPVGSNVRTIYSVSQPTLDDNVFSITGLSWCSLAGTGKLAFTVRTIINGSPVDALYTISQNGGAPTLIETVSDGTMKSPTWSPDDSKIGVFVNPYRTSSSTTTAYNWHLHVVNASTGAVLEDDPLSTLANVILCEWARSGNTIAFDGKTTTSGAYNIYYINYGSLTGPYTQNVPGRNPTWSPNNATIMMGNVDVATASSLMQKINAFGSTVSTILSSAPNIEFKWKR